MGMHTHHLINCRVHWGHQCVAVAGPRQTEESGALQCGRLVAGQQSCYFNVCLPCVYGCASVFMVWSSAYVGSSECCSIQRYTMVAASVICSQNAAWSQLSSLVLCVLANILLQHGPAKSAGFWGSESKKLCVQLHPSANCRQVTYGLQPYSFKTYKHLHRITYTYCRP